MEASGRIKKISKHHHVLSRLSNVLKGKHVVPSMYESGSTIIYNGYSFSHSVTNDYLRTLGESLRAFLRRSS